MENQNNSGKIIAALIAGAAVGAAIGILFAPDKGSETRKKMAGSGEDFVETLKAKFGEMIDGVKKEVNSMKNEAGEFAETASKTADAHGV
jgi:gas vesicle protein